MKENNPLERDIEKAVVDYARSKNILCYKFTSPNRRSVPDRLLIAPGGRVFFIEFKRLGQKPTTAQQIEINKLRIRVPVFVCDTVSVGKAAVDWMLER